MTEIVDVLLETPYRDALSGIAVSVEEVEKHLQGYAARLFHLPAKFLQGGVRNLVDWLWRHYEVDNLIILLRAIHHRQPVARIRAALVPLGPSTDLNWQALSLAGSLDAVIDRLSASAHGSRYALALEQASGEYQRRGNVFVLEIALYLAYYRRLRSLVDGLPGTDGRDARLFVATILDGRNLLWAYRYRIFFGLSAEEILGYTLHRGVRVGAETVRRIATGTPLAELVSSVWGGRLPGADRLVELSEGDALVRLELILQRYLFGLAERVLEGHPLRLGVVLGYIVLVESEVEDLTAVIEGVSSGWSEERIRSYLIGSRRRR